MRQLCVASNTTLSADLDFIHFAVLICILVSIKLNSNTNVIIQGIARSSWLLIGLTEVSDQLAHILEVCELVIADGAKQLFNFLLPFWILSKASHHHNKRYNNAKCCLTGRQVQCARFWVKLISVIATHCKYQTSLIVGAKTILQSCMQE